jgi:hypothetical protein
MAAIFREWLVREWCLHQNGREPVGGSQAAQDALGDFGRPAGEPPSPSPSLHSGFWKKIVPCHRLRGAPMQTDIFSCGDYTLRFTESILEMLRGPWARGIIPLDQRGDVVWPAGVPKFTRMDVWRSRRLYGPIIACCRVRGLFEALSQPKVGKDLGDGILCAAAAIVTASYATAVESDVVIVEDGEPPAQPGWAVLYAQGNAVAWAAPAPSVSSSSSSNSSSSSSSRAAGSVTAAMPPRCLSSAAAAAAAASPPAPAPAGAVPLSRRPAAAAAAAAASPNPVGEAGAKRKRETAAAATTAAATTAAAAAAQRPQRATAAAARLASMEEEEEEEEEEEGGGGRG